MLTRLSSNEDYLFSSNPTIHVYASALEAYQNSRWAEYGTIVGDLTEEIINRIEDHEINEEMFNGQCSMLNDAIYDLSGRRVDSKFKNQNSKFNGQEDSSLFTLHLRRAFTL